MKTSDEMKNQIKKWEGLRLNAYLCPSGVRTIGYGHTSGVFPDTITIEQANKFFDEDITLFESLVNKYNQCYDYDFTQGQFDALVSFTFNCGGINLLKLIANGTRSKEEISDKILLYNKSHGKTLSGLVNRRKIEREYFLKNINSVYGLNAKPIKNPYTLYVKAGYRLRTNCDLLVNSIDRVVPKITFGEYIKEVHEVKNGFAKITLENNEVKWVHVDGISIKWNE